jgi:multidrug efflux pump subunit AcrA (membrane-fusion protein)
VTETQASELTLTLTEAATRPIQTWIRTAGMLGNSGKTVTALLRAPEAELVQVGQRLRTFSIDSRTQMHQARISRINRTSAGTSIEATLSDRAHDNGSRYLMEIVVERGRFLSVPNVSIVEEGTGPVVYVQQSPGRYAPRTIHIGLQGELYTEVLDGLEEGDQVVSIGSFFVDADSKLNSTNAQ